MKDRNGALAGKMACPDLIIVPPRMDLYLKFSSMLREIYGEYTDLVEPYGCDEAWLDVTDSAILKGDGRKIAEEISWRVKKELGITVASVFPGIRSSQSWEVIIKSLMGLQRFQREIIKNCSGDFRLRIFCMSDVLPGRLWIVMELKQLVSLLCRILSF